MPAFVELTGVCKSFQEGSKRREVLKNLSAQFHEGEFVAIMGKSGSGKSTLLNIISGIDDVDSGEVMVANFPLSSADEDARTLFRRKRMGYIFQSFQLIPFLNVWDNVCFSLRLNGLLDDEGKERIMGLSKRSGIDGLLGAMPEKLSGGEQQRVAIVRALAHDPSLILADEPTGNLDEENSEQIVAMLSGLVKNLGKTLLMVTHSEEVASKADRIFHVHHGMLERE